MKKTTTTITDAGKLPAADAETIRRIWQDMAGKQVDIITVESLAVDIVPLDRLIKEMVMLQRIAERTIDGNDPPQILDLLTEISTWLPYTGKLVASAAKYWNDAKLQHLSEPAPDHLKGEFEKRKYREAKAADAQYIYDYVYRLNSAMNSRSEHLVSLLSYQKALTTNLQK